MRAAIIIALVSSTLPLWAVAEEKKYEVYTGKVAPLKGMIEKEGIKLDNDAAALMIGFTVDGKSYPIIKDEGGRRFFKDERLLNRDYRITGKIIGGTMFQVIKVEGIKDGKIIDIYYWCDICAIRRNEKNACDCCGGPLELREEPLAK